MITQMRQALQKLFFCIRVSDTLRTCLRLLWYSKSFARFQRRQVQVASLHQETALSYRLTLSGQSRKIFLRTRAGDFSIFYEMFLEKPYILPRDLLRAQPVILDAGSNIGMSALFFLQQFPACRLFCLEADPDNCRLFYQNLAPELQSGQVQLIAKALMGRSGIVLLERSGWAYNTKVGNQAGPGIQVEALMPEEWLAGIGAGTVDLLKMDIEGAEEGLFMDLGWLGRVNNILIELHSPAVEDIIRQRLNLIGFYWYPWHHGPSSSALYLACRKPLPSATAGRDIARI